MSDNHQSTDKKEAPEETSTWPKGGKRPPHIAAAEKSADREQDPTSRADTEYNTLSREP